MRGIQGAIGTGAYRGTQPADQGHAPPARARAGPRACERDARLEDPVAPHEPRGLLCDVQQLRGGLRRRRELDQPAMGAGRGGRIGRGGPAEGSEPPRETQRAGAVASLAAAPRARTG